MYEELIEKLKKRNITKDELIKLKEIVERRIKEFEEKGECEKAQTEAFILKMVENLLEKYSSTS